MNRNISETKDCYGCGVCDVVCPQKIIDISLNKDGFYEPYIVNPDKCTGCGLCIRVCSFNQDGLSLKVQNIHSYGAWSKDPIVRKRCTSGGVGFELGKYLLGQGYKVCGVKYNAEKNQAEHYIASTLNDLIPSIGSKYIQSYTVDGFRNINRKEKYLVTGTPCQIDSFRRYIQGFHCEDNFILMDFFCHGIPSKLMWDKYISSVAKSIGKITYASWRNKFTGEDDSFSINNNKEFIDWHESYNMLIKGENGFLNSRLSQGNQFLSLFLGDQCLGKQCYENCKFKYNHSSADIRIGDFWGETYKKDKKGVSCAVAFTIKGNNLLHSIDCELKEYPFEVIAEGQMKTMPQKNRLHDRLFDKLHDNKASIADVYNLQLAYNKMLRNFKRLKHPFHTILSITKKIVNKL